MGPKQPARTIRQRSPPLKLTRSGPCGSGPDGSGHACRRACPSASSFWLQSGSGIRAAYAGWGGFVTENHILDDAQVPYPDDADLPKLWNLAAEQLNLAPRQHEEKVFKSILGNCQAVVNLLGAIRNRIGDAHGQGRRPVKPKPRHAELAVNLAGTMAAFLVSTWKDRATE